MRSMATDDRHMGHLASGNPAGPHPSDPLPQTLGGSLQSCYYEPNHEPIRRPTAGLRHPCACRSKVWQALPDASECFRVPEGFLIALTERAAVVWFS